MIICKPNRLLLKVAPLASFTYIRGIEQNRRLTAWFRSKIGNFSPRNYLRLHPASEARVVRLVERVCKSPDVRARLNSQKVLRRRLIQAMISDRLARFML